MLRRYRIALAAFLFAALAGSHHELAQDRSAGLASRVKLQLRARLSPDSYDFQFKLFDSVSTPTGAQQGRTVEISGGRRIRRSPLFNYMRCVCYE
jgi:hypothetical protein